MTKAKLTVTVAILAYNEERYISGLIQSIYAQTRSNFKLDRISLYYDGGTDSTVAKVERHFPQVTIHSFKTNRGKSFRINQLVGQNTSDILIQLDADVLLQDTSVFSRLVAPFYSHRRPGIVCAYHRALPDRSLISRIAFFGYRVWDRSRTSLGQRGTRYYCEGGLRAFSRQFTDVFRIPLHRHIGEDTYSFLFAVSHGFRVSVAKQAIVIMDFPHTFADYSRQMKRFLSDPAMTAGLFDQLLVDRYSPMTPALKVHSLLQEFVNDPFIGLAYLFVQGLVKIQMLFYHQPITWIPITR